MACLANPGVEGLKRACQTPYPDRGGACCKQGPAGFPGGRACGHHVIDQNQVLASYIRLATEGLTQITLALVTCQALLMRGSATALQGRYHRALPVATEQLGQSLTLVKPPAPAAQPMHGQWANQVTVRPWERGVREKLLQGPFVDEFSVIFEPLNQHVQRELIGVERGAGGEVRWATDAAAAQRGRLGDGWGGAKWQAAATLVVGEGLQKGQAVAAEWLVISDTAKQAGGGLVK